MTTRIFGSGIKRREDPRLITGNTRYTDDFQLPGMVYMAVVRSPHAHARITGIDTSAAKSSPGVVAVFTGQDVTLGAVPCAWLIPGSDLKTPAHPALAKDVVRHVGDGVAIVVATDRYLAQDAADLVQVSYDVLPAVVSPEDATKEGAPLVHDDVPNNISFRWIASSGDDGVENAFNEAAAGGVVVTERIVQQRLLPTAMEPRSAVAQWDPFSAELTVYSTSQNPHIARFILSGMTGVPEHKLRVVAPEVGGGFGSKIPVYPDEALTAWAAMKLNMPVKWTETRSENYLVTIHGRDHIEYVEMAATRDGKITGIRGKVYAGMGAYLSTAAPGIPTILHGLMYSGPYTIPNIRAETIGVFTNTAPVDAYRGAGRPEATFLIERLVDKLAATLNMDPVEVRRKNLIPPFENGHNVAIGLTYDSGDYETALNKALAMVDYDG
ncbi:MAG TPA: xanthine dehydrogenase family protein molybdopterin-binding subunit, partial [Ktedonobacterales bacterium]|nr:xanthine dehydrogenase family protein molybdopterin-binding subunit [Ktedonobacterales bacterium]